MLGVAKSVGASAVLFLLSMLASTTYAANTVIVYDASNSMWGQIGGEAKVIIARRVLTGIIRDWEKDAPLGLVAYGHRRKGDCTDIQTLVPVGPVDRDALISRVESISPKGKTPLTAAIRHAAETVKYQDAPANVVLISDGIETCNADPCAVASELNRAGINFTAHVIGFDVGDADQAQLRCIAENTGGRFFAARDAEGLQSALGEAARIATETPAEPKVSLSAPASAVAGSQIEVSWQGDNVEPRDRVTIVRADAEADVRGESERVADKRSATLLAPGRTGAHEARYIASATGNVVARAAIELTEPRVSLSAPVSVSGGADFELQWRNAVHPRDYVTVVPADAASDAYQDYLRVHDDSSGTLQAPAEPGRYEVRYLLVASGEAVARAALDVEAESVSVSAPESVTGGADFTVQWDNVVHPRDYVTVVPGDAPVDAYEAYIRVRDKRSGTLQAPAEPGDYEVRYLLQESGEAIASAPLRVTGQEVSVTAPVSVTGGTDFTVSWSNVVHPRDYVTVVPADTPVDEYGEYIRVRDGREGTLQAPAEPGEYEVRYMLQQSGRAIATAPLEITGAETSVTAPQTVTAGTVFTVSWSNVIHPRDYVTVVPADTPVDEYGEYIRVRDGREGTLQAPAEPGEYEVRYMLQQSGETIARAPIRVAEASTSVSAPDTVTGGAVFEVSWSNGVHPRDYVTIVPAEASADVYREYKRVRDRSRARLPAPAEPGRYEVRYLLQASGEAIAATPVEVVAPEVSVAGPESVTAGSRFRVQWDNAIHPRDYVTIVPAHAPADQYGDYKRVGDGKEGTLEAPAEPGAHEVRYLLKVSGRAIASAPIQVTGPEVIVSAPETVQRGSKFTVSWRNAVHPRDYVTVVAADAPADAYGDYKRVRDRSEVRLEAPQEAGNYEVRYLLKVSGAAVARTTLRVE